MYTLTRFFISIQMIVVLLLHNYTMQARILFMWWGLENVSLLFTLGIEPLFTPCKKIPHHIILKRLNKSFEKKMHFN